MYLPRVNWLKLDCLKERLAARWNHFFYWLHTADSRRGPETQNNQQAVAQNHGKETFKPFWCGFGGLHENKIYSVNFWDNKSLWRITLLKRRQVPKRWKSCAKTLRKPFTVDIKVFSQLCILVGQTSSPSSNIYSGRRRKTAKSREKQSSSQMPACIC